MSDSILQVNLIKDKGGNATGITVADSSANVTIGNLTATSLAGGTIASGVNFPTKVTDKTYFFPFDRSGVASSSYGNYRTSGITSSNPTRATAIVPSQTTTIVGASFCWVAAATDTYRIGIKISANSNGEAYNSNDLSSTVFVNNVSKSGDTVYIENLLSITAISNFFTNNISANDVLGFYTDHQSGGNANDLGIFLTFRF